jgi:hypothetical protein
VADGGNFVRRIVPACYLELLEQPVVERSHRPPSQCFRLREGPMQVPPEIAPSANYQLNEVEFDAVTRIYLWVFVQRVADDQLDGVAPP